MAVTTFFATPPTLNIALVKSFICDAVVSLAPSYENNITSHKVEGGASISDHAYNRNPVLKIKGVVSNSFVDEYFNNEINYDTVSANYSPGRVREAYDLLYDLWRDRTPFTVVGEYHSYKNCVLKSFSTDYKQDTADALIFDLTVEQIRIATTKEVAVALLEDTLRDDAATNKAGNETKKKANEHSFLFFKTVGESLDESQDIGVSVLENLGIVSPDDSE